MKLKIIDRYIFNELVKVFLIGVAALTMVLFVDKLLFMSKMILNRGVTMAEVGWILIYISPAFLSVTIPMSVLVASVVVFNQFSAYNEIIAMKASSRSFIDLLKPVLYFSMMAYLIANMVMFYALPWGNQSYKEIIFDIIKNRANLDIQPGVFTKDFKNLTIMVNERKEDSSLIGVFISDSTVPETPKTITAKRGIIFTDRKNLRIQLQLFKGTIHEISSKGRDYQTTNFDRYELTLTLQDTDRMEKKAMVGNRELSLAQLRQKIADMKEKGFTASGPIVEMSKKFAIPFACLLFGLLGAPMGIKSSRSGKSGSFAMAILLILLYYLVLVFTQNMGKIGKINPYLSVWIPNFIMLGVGGYIIYKMQNELPFKFFNWMGDRFSAFWGMLKKLYFLFKPTATRSGSRVLQSQSHKDKLNE